MDAPPTRGAGNDQGLYLVRRALSPCHLSQADVALDARRKHHHVTNQKMR
jgi:hypothetical protein